MTNKLTCEICTDAAHTTCFICYCPFCEPHLSSQAHVCYAFVSQGEDIIQRIERLEKRIDGVNKYLQETGNVILDLFGTTRAALGGK